jgi:hypothetical protein
MSGLFFPFLGRVRTGELRVQHVMGTKNTSMLWPPALAFSIAHFVRYPAHIAEGWIGASRTEQKRAPDEVVFGCMQRNRQKRRDSRSLN